MTARAPRFSVRVEVALPQKDRRDIYGRPRTWSMKELQEWAHGISEQTAALGAQAVLSDPPSDAGFSLRHHVYTNVWVHDAGDTLYAALAAAGALAAAVQAMGHNVSCVETIDSDSHPVVAGALFQDELKPIGWYRTADVWFAAKHFGFPPSPAKGEQWTASDGSVWVYRLTGTPWWEMSQYPGAVKVDE